MKTNQLLTAVVILQGVILIGQWTGSGVSLPAAHAQVPDPANRQMQMIDELKSVNTKLDRIASVLEGGQLQVRVAKTEENKGEPRAK